MTSIIETALREQVLTDRLTKARKFDPNNSCLRHDDDFKLNWLYATKAIKDSASTWQSGGKYDGKTAANEVLEWLTVNRGVNFWRLSKHIWKRDRFMAHSPRNTKDDPAYDRRSGIHKDITINSQYPEKNIARLMVKFARGKDRFDTDYSDIGRPLNFEVPIYEHRGEPYDGIDMISYDAATSKMFLLELKRPRSQESLLRCVLESYTYLKAIGNWKRFIADFNDENRNIKIHKCATLVACPLIFKDPAVAGSRKSERKQDHSIPYVDFMNLKTDKRFCALCNMINQDLQENVFHDKHDHLTFAFLREESYPIDKIIHEINQPRNTITKL